MTRFSTRLTRDADTERGSRVARQAPSRWRGRGGWTLETAEAVANRDGDLDVFGGLAALVDASLVRRIEQPDDHLRFGMLETIREFALERLAASDEEAAIRDAHAAQFHPLAERHFQEFWGPDQLALFQQLDAEHPNLRAALAWLMAAGRSDDALALAGALSYFWYAQGHFAEGQRWLEQALAASDAGGVVRARALYGAGAIRWSQGDYATAQTQLEDAVQLAHAAGATDLEAWCLANLGHVAEFRGDDPTAIRCYEQSLALARVADLRPIIAHALINLGDARYRQGDRAQAETLVRESLAIFDDLQVNFVRSMAWSTLGYLVLARGDLAAALEVFDASLALALAIHESWMIANDLAAYGAAAAAAGRYEQAARLLGAAETARDVAGHRRLANHFQQAETRAKVRAVLDEGAFTQAWTEGRAIPTELATAEAQALSAELRAQRA